MAGASARLTQINPRNNVAQTPGWRGPTASEPGNQEGDAARSRQHNVSAESRRLHPSRRGDAKTGDVPLGITSGSCRKASTGRPPTAPSRCMAIGSSTRARTISSTRSTRRPASSRGKPRVLDPPRRRTRRAGPDHRQRQVITGRCEPGAAPTPASSPRTTRRPARAVAHAYDSAAGEPGDETWGDMPMEKRRHVGTWMVPSYDPQLNLIDIGTSVTIPAPKFLLGGNENSTSITTRRSRSTPTPAGSRGTTSTSIDHWDLDHPFPRLLVDTAVAPIRARCRGSIRASSRANDGHHRVAGKTGIVYTLDRRHRRVPVGPPDRHAERVAIDGATGQVDGQSGNGCSRPLGQFQRFV